MIYSSFKFLKRLARKSVEYTHSGFGNSLRHLIRYSDFVRLINLRPRVPYHVSLFGKLIYFPDAHWFLHSLNEIFVEEVYKSFISRESPFIIDCGANIGLSVIYFKRLNPSARIIAFEPDKNIFSTLTKNVEQFKFENVHLVNKGVWNADTILSFQAEGTVGGKLIDHVSSSNSENVMSIETTRLVSYLDQQVDFLKIDIEGAEYEVIKDCADFLKNVRTLFIEYHSSTKQPQRLDEILAVVSKAGFRYYIKQAWDKIKHPFVDKKGRTFDLQLNIFCYRYDGN